MTDYRELVASMRQTVDVASGSLFELSIASGAARQTIRILCMNLRIACAHIEELASHQHGLDGEPQEPFQHREKKDGQ